MSYDAPPPPPNPYGQPNQPYGQPYGQPGQPGQGQHPPAYAHWGKRVAALLLDALFMLIAYVPVLIGIILIAVGSETTTVNGVTTVQNDDVGPLPLLLIAVGAIAYLAFAIWNYIIRQGRTGCTLGKSALGIKLVGEQDGQPIGAGKAFLRQLAHIVDSLPCYLGYLWPLWDAKRQTFADKIMSSIVIEAPKS